MTSVDKQSNWRPLTKSNRFTSSSNSFSSSASARAASDWHHAGFFRLVLSDFEDAIDEATVESSVSGVEGAAVCLLDSSAVFDISQKLVSLPHAP